MKAQIRNVDDHGVSYQTLAFVCPGCASVGGSGLHLLPVNTTEHSPSWDWDGNLERPTVEPSILTGGGQPFTCHSFLRNGVFEFLSDSTHRYAGQSVEIPDLPDWFINEQTDDKPSS